MHLRQRRRARQRPELQRHLDDHALRIAPDIRREERRMVEPHIRLHLRHMLVREAERIGAECFERVVRRRLVLELGDHLLAAARIARHRVHGEWPVLRHDARRDERPRQRDRARRIAARIGDARGARDRLPLPRRHFRKTVDPAIRHPVRRRGINDARRRIADQRLALLRRLVRQAQDHDVGLVQRFFPRARILALLLAQRNEVEIVAALQPRPDLQPRRPRFAVDENLGGHVSLHKKNKGASFPRTAFP